MAAVQVRSEVATLAQRICTQVDRAVVGKSKSVQMAVVTLLSGGHLLIEDIPGVGKTTLAKSMARAIGGDFRRIQFTPDLLPADVTGSSIFNQKESTFEYRPGPIFANVVLADEINRATPKTQSALLEAMEESQVSSEGETRPLPTPFFVVATQNSVEMTGTYPLPEAQLDRFFARISLGYPDRASELEMMSSQQTGHPVDDILPVVSLDEVSRAQGAIREVYAAESVREYILDIIRATRNGSQFLLGASPRSTLHLLRASQAFAAMRDGEYVTPDDVKAVVAAVISHRVIPKAELRIGGSTVEDAIRTMLLSIPAPVPGA